MQDNDDDEYQQDTLIAASGNNHGEQSELSMEPIKLQRLDLASVLVDQNEGKTYGGKAQGSSFSKNSRGASPQLDCMLSASIFNGDNPIPKPPKTKPVNMGSLNFDSLKSCESQTSRGSTSFKLARLALDDTLNRSLEGIIVRGSAEKKKKFSPYKTSKSRGGDSRERAIDIVNHSSTTSAAGGVSSLKLRQHTKQQARPLSARSSTPIVPKPGATKPRASSRSGKDLTNTSQTSYRSTKQGGRPPTTTNPYKQQSKPLPGKKPPQPAKIRKQPSTSSARGHGQDGGDPSAELVYSTSMPSALKRSSSIKSATQRIGQEATGMFQNHYLKMPQQQQQDQSNSMTGSSTAVGCSSHRMDTSQSVVNLIDPNHPRAFHSNNYQKNSSAVSSARFKLEPEIQSDKMASKLEEKVEREASQRRRNSIQASTNSESVQSSSLKQHHQESSSHGELPLQQRYQSGSNNHQQQQYVTFNRSSYPSQKQQTQMEPTNDFSRQERELIKFAEQKLMQKSIRELKRLVQGQQQKSRLAHMFHRSRLVANVVQKWRSLKFIRQDQSQLARLHLSRVLPLFEKSKTFKAMRKAFQEMKKLTLGEAAFDVYRLGLLKQCFHDGLATFAEESQRKKAVMRDIDDLYEKKLSAKALACLSDYKKYHQHQTMHKDLADQFYLEHRGVETKRKAYDTLVSFAIYAKQSEGARAQHRLSLLYKALVSLRDYKEDQHKREESVKLVTSFYKCSLATKAVKTLRENTVMRKQHREIAMEKYQTRRMGRCLTKLKAYARGQASIVPMAEGVQLMACQLWLKHSFTKVMEKVWKDFPRQELKTDPDNGETLPLKNYLSLSRHPRRGLPTFYRCNRNYRRHLQGKVLDALNLHTLKRKKRLRQFKADKLRRFFHSFYRVTRNYHQMRLFRDSKLQNEEMQITHRVFEALKSTTQKEKLLRHNFEIVQESHLRQQRKNGFQVWLTHSKKVIALAKCEEVSFGIDRHRTMTRYLALWFQQLHKRLKCKHMAKVQEQFYQRSTRAKFLTLWKGAYQRNLDLRQKDSTIVQMQERLILQKYLKVLSDYAIGRRSQTLKKRTADQEYIYWLGKRAIATLKRYYNHRRASKEMTEMVVTDRANCVKQKILSSMSLYCRFHRERRMADLQVVQSIEHKRKFKALRSWTKLYSQRVGARVLAQTLESGVQRFALHQIKRVQILDDANVELFKEHAPTILLREIILGWKRLTRRQLYHKAMLEKFMDARMARYYETWRGLYLTEQAKIDFFNKTVICIKNNISKRAFKSLALNSLKGRLKKRADVYRYTKTLQKVVESLRGRLYRRLRSIEQFQTLQAQSHHSALQSHFSQWNKRFAKKTALRAASVDARLYKLSKIFTEFKANKNYQQGKRANVASLKSQLSVIKARRSLLKFKTITAQLATDRLEGLQAHEYHRNFMYKKVAMVWFSHFKKSHSIFQRFKRFRAKQARQAKLHFLKQWTQGSRAALLRVKAAQNANQLLNKLQRRQYYLKWVSEVNFLIKLEACQEAGIVHINRMRVAKALNHLSQVSQALVFEREKRFQTQDYSDRKTMLKAFACLYRYKEQRVQTSHLKDQAKAECNLRRQKNAFAALCHNFAKDVQLRQAQQLLKESQVRLYGPKLFAFWRQRMHYRIQVRTQTLTADGFDQQRLSRKAFNGLLVQVYEARHKARLLEQARAFRDRKTLDRGVRSLLLYLCHRREKQERATHALETVGLLQESSLTQQVFAALVANMLQARKNANLAANFSYKRLTSQCLHELDSHKEKCKKLKAIQVTIEQKQMQSQKAKTLRLWNEAYVIQRALKAASQTHQASIVAKCFQALARQVELKKKLAVANQIRGVTATVKAFMSLKKHVIFNRVKRDIEVKAMLHHAKVLKKKGLKAFDVCLTRRLATDRIQMHVLQRLQSNAFTTWEDKLQLKLLRNDALSVCRLVFLRRALRDWRLSAEQGSQEERAVTVHKVQLVAKGWSSLRLHLYRAKCGRYLQEKTQQALQISVLRQWASLVDPEQARGRAFHKKIMGLTQLRDHFNTLKTFASTDKALVEQAQPLVERTQRQLAKTVLSRMVQLTQAGSKLRSLDSIVIGKLKQQAFARMHEHAIELIEEQGQLIETIEFFGNRRPQNLLMFQKVFLAMSSSNQAQEQEQEEQKKTSDGVELKQRIKICNGTLAKYCFEKWRNVRPKLALSKEKLQVAMEHHRAALIRQVWTAMATHSKQVRHKSCISMYLSQTHDDNLFRAVFIALKDNADRKLRKRTIIEVVQARRIQATKTAIVTKWKSFSARRAQLRSLEESIASQQRANLKFEYLAQMREIALKRVNDQSIVQAFDSRRLRTLAWTVLYVLHDYARSQRERRATEDTVSNFRRHNLLKRGILSLKLQHSQRMTKHRYSRLFAVFTAWKTVTKENNLLNMYLAECNYKQKAMMNQSHTIEQMGSSSKKKKNRMAAFGGGTDEGDADDDGTFSAGQELVFTAAGHLSFADSMIVDYHQPATAQASSKFQPYQLGTNQHNQQQLSQLQQSTIQHHVDSSEQLGLTDLGGLEDDDRMNSRDNNFLFGCKPSVPNQKSFQRRFGGETSSEDERLP